MGRLSYLFVYVTNAEHEAASLAVSSERRRVIGGASRRDGALEKPRSASGQLRRTPMLARMWQDRPPQTTFRPKGNASSLRSFCCAATEGTGRGCGKCEGGQNCLQWRCSSTTVRYANRVAGQRITFSSQPTMLTENRNQRHRLKSRLRSVGAIARGPSESNWQFAT
jgi:hypothetical protein